MSAGLRRAKWALPGRWGRSNPGFSFSGWRPARSDRWWSRSRTVWCRRIRSGPATQRLAWYECVSSSPLHLGHHSSAAASAMHNRWRSSARKTALSIRLRPEGTAARNARAPGSASERKVAQAVRLEIDRQIDNSYIDELISLPTSITLTIHIPWYPHHHDPTSSSATRSTRPSTNSPTLMASWHDHGDEVPQLTAEPLKLKHMGHMGVSIVMGIPQNGWFVMETPMKMDDNYRGTHISGNLLLGLSENCVSQNPLAYHHFPY